MLSTNSYAENFAEKFPSVSLNQSWDYSTGGFVLKSGTRAGENVSIQSISGLDFGVSDNKPTENTNIFNTVATTLPDYEKHEGQPVVLVAPSSSFYIFPISAQGQNTYDLFVKVGDEAPVKVFSKNWTDFWKPYVNGMKDGDITANMSGVLIQAPVGTRVELYLDNVRNGSEVHPSVGTSNGQAIYLDALNDIDLTLPNGYTLAEEAVIKYIGIEDIDKTKDYCDNDYNDLVLAVVGNPDVPAEVIIENNQYTVPVSVAKRYFIEDLGSLDDFDFNDIVVDVFQDYNILHNVTLENGQIKSDVASDPVAVGQRAIVRALGGTIDIELQIGSKTWKKSSKFNVKEMLNTSDIDYNKKLDEFTVTGWNPDANNVSVRVEEASGNVYTVEFPKSGSAPMIIAKDINKKWQGERQSVTAAWFSK